MTGPLDEQMSEAVRRQLDHAAASRRTDRTGSDPGRSGCAATAQAVSILACHLHSDRHHRCSLDHHPGDHRCLCGVVFLPKGKEADRDGLAETIHHEDGPQPPRGGSGGSV